MWSQLTWVRYFIPIQVPWLIRGLDLDTHATLVTRQRLVCTSFTPRYSVLAHFVYIYEVIFWFSFVFWPRIPMKCREVDTVDLRRKLPYAVGVLHRLLRMCHRVYVTCTTGLDRSPTCVIAYLHWIQDVSLPRAYDFVTAVHPSGPDRWVAYPIL